MIIIDTLLILLPLAPPAMTPFSPRFATPISFRFSPRHISPFSAIFRYASYDIAISLFSSSSR